MSSSEAYGANEVDSEGHPFRVEHMPNKPKAHQRKARDRLDSVKSHSSTDSGYSSLHASSSSSAGEPEGRRRPIRVRRDRESASYAEPPGTQRVSNEHQRGTNSICWNADCRDPNCLQERDQPWHQDHGPGVNLHPPPSNNVHPTHDPNPFAFIGNPLETPHREYGPPFGYTQSPAPAYGHYASDHPVHPGYMAPYPTQYPPAGNISPPYHPPYPNLANVPGPVPLTPHYTDLFYPSSQHHAPGRQTDYASFAPNPYTRENVHAPHDTRYSAVPPPAPTETHRQRREHQPLPKRSTHRQSDATQQETKAKLREARRTKTGLTPELKKTRSGDHASSDQRKVSPQPTSKPTLGPDPNPEANKHASVESADESADELSTAPPSASDPLNCGHGDVHNASPPGTNLSGTQPTLDQDPTADDAAGVVQSGNETESINDLVQGDMTLIEDLPPPYLPSIVETAESDSEEHEPQQAAVQEVEHVTQSGHHSTSPALSPGLLVVNEDSTQSTAQKPSTSPAVSPQEEGTSESIAEAPAETQPASCGMTKLVDAVDEVDDTAKQDAIVDQQRQKSTAIGFSEALIRRCRSIQKFDIKAPQKLQVDVVALLEVFSQLAYESATSDRERLAAKSVAEHRR